MRPIANLDSSGGMAAGTAGGTFLSMLASLRVDDVVHTILLAGIGAVTSFILSLLMKHLLKPGSDPD